MIDAIKKFSAIPAAVLISLISWLSYEFYFLLPILLATAGLTLSYFVIFRWFKLIRKSNPAEDKFHHKKSVTKIRKIKVGPPKVSKRSLTKQSRKTAIYYAMLDKRPVEREKVVVDMNGSEFEQFIASELIKDNWNAKVSSPGADQGLDILARKGEITVAIQCKRYSGAVGNKAVQEVHSARTFFEANRACVVTTSYFTPSAKVLAKKLNIKLIHHSEIHKLHEILMQCS